MMIDQSHHSPLSTRWELFVCYSSKTVCGRHWLSAVFILYKIFHKDNLTVLIVIGVIKKIGHQFVYSLWYRFFKTFRPDY